MEIFSKNKIKDENIYYVKIIGYPDKQKMKKLEDYILKNKITSIRKIDIIYSNNNYYSALKLQQELTDRYAINASMRIHTLKLDANYLVIEKIQQRINDCYEFELYDFNWYRANSRDLARYTEREICSANNNDLVESMN